jgi:hypothetical protein
MKYGELFRERCCRRYEQQGICQEDIFLHGVLIAAKFYRAGFLAASHTPNFFALGTCNPKHRTQIIGISIFETLERRGRAKAAHYSVPQRFPLWMNLQSRQRCALMCVRFNLYGGY